MRFCKKCTDGQGIVLIFPGWVTHAGQLAGAGCCMILRVEELGSWAADTRPQNITELPIHTHHPRKNERHEPTFTIDYYRP